MRYAGIPDYLLRDKDFGWLAVVENLLRRKGVVRRNNYGASLKLYIASKKFMVNLWMLENLIKLYFYTRTDEVTCFLDGKTGIQP